MQDDITKVCVPVYLVIYVLEITKHFEQEEEQKYLSLYSD